MATQTLCPDDPKTNWATKVCVIPVSKNVEGKLLFWEKLEETCEKPTKCATLKTRHTLNLKLSSHQPCESKLGKSLNGTMGVSPLITVFDTDGHHRGFHAGTVSMGGTNFKGLGNISGMTNVGTHRKPAFDDCQPCDARGVMEGRICVKIGSNNPELKGARLFGTYRLRFDPSPTGGEGKVQGVIEGVIVVPCK